MSEKARCRWCDRERAVTLMRRWDGQWECQDWVRCGNVARRRRDVNET